SALAAKLALVSTAALATAVVVAHRAERVAPTAPTIVAPELALDLEPELAIAPRVTAVARDVAAVAPGRAAPSRPARLSAPAPAPAPAPPPPAPSPAPAAATLAREIQLVDRAMASLRAQRYAAVLITVHTYDAETAGGGQLAEDAAAIAVEAMCRSGD